MTCIVGITDGTNVYIGGDRAAADDVSIISMAAPKVYQRDQWVFGFAGSVGIGQMLQLITMPIVEDNEDPFFVLRMDVVNQFKNLLDDQGIDIDGDASTEFLIGIKGRLFEFSPQDWGIIEIRETSIGSGAPFALGSLYTSLLNDRTDPIERITSALYSAITYSPTCQGPIDIVIS